MLRWQQRFDNFEKAFLLLSSAFQETEKTFNDLEKEGIIQRFEYTFELMWKVLKDKMEADGIVLERISPKYVIKKAFQSKYLDEVDVWLQMCDTRNLLSHTYDFEQFTVIFPKIRQEFLPVLTSFYQKFKQLYAEE